ncbi:response regulator [Nostocales cyanobacterium LEGE 11386]|nr:response regulator [Nostocales cyanobacterium LEGE 11386]
MVSLTKKRILCVDDSEDNCDLFSFILTEAEYEVESAYSFTEALQIIKTRQFNLCLFDINLPDGTGFELLEKVHAINPSISIIVCSGNGDDFTHQQAMQAGAQAFLTKPIDFDLLVKTINQLLKLD